MTTQAWLHSKMSKQEVMADKYFSWAIALRNIAAKSEDPEKSARFHHLSEKAIEKAQLILN